MLALTPTVPHSVLPSVDSINTRVVAATHRDLPRLVARTKPGASVTVEVWHKGETKDSTVVVEELS
jgi:S1-C subfamily serine protease